MSLRPKGAARRKRKVGQGCSTNWVCWMSRLWTSTGHGPQYSKLRGNRRLLNSLRSSYPLSRVFLRFPDLFENHMFSNDSKTLVMQAVESTACGEAKPPRFLNVPRWGFRGFVDGR